MHGLSNREKEKKGREKNSLGSRVELLSLFSYIEQFRGHFA